MDLTNPHGDQPGPIVELPEIRAAGCDGEEWNDSHMITGVFGIVRFIAPNGETGFQIVASPGHNFNELEIRGMADLVEDFCQAFLIHVLNDPEED